MPYKLRKAPKRDLYWVVAQDGTKKSKEPIPLERAKAQMRALYAAEKRGKGEEEDEELARIFGSMDVAHEGAERPPAPAPAPAPAPRPKKVKKVKEAEPIPNVLPKKRRHSKMEGRAAPVCLPRDEFIQEHRHLLKILKPVVEERAKQSKELKGVMKKGGRNMDYRAEIEHFDTLVGQLHEQRQLVADELRHLNGVRMSPSYFGLMPNEQDDVMNRITYLAKQDDRLAKRIRKAEAELTRLTRQFEQLQREGRGLKKGDVLSLTIPTGGRAAPPNQPPIELPPQPPQNQDLLAQLQEHLAQLQEELANLQAEYANLESDYDDLVAQHDQPNIDEQDRQHLEEQIQLILNELYHLDNDITNKQGEIQFIQQQIQAILGQQGAGRRGGMDENPRTLSRSQRAAAERQHAMNESEHFMHRIAHILKTQLLEDESVYGARSLGFDSREDLVNALHTRRFDWVKYLKDKGYARIRNLLRNNHIPDEEIRQYFAAILRIHPAAAESDVVEELANIPDEVESEPVAPPTRQQDVNELTAAITQIESEIAQIEGLAVANPRGFSPQFIAILQSTLPDLRAKRKELKDRRDLFKARGRFTGCANTPTRFQRELQQIGLSPSAYLKEVRRRAKAYGINPKNVRFSDKSDKKMMVVKPDSSVVYFGATNYGDHIIWSYLETTNQAASGTAAQKREVFRRSHSKIKGDWKKDMYSANNLALSLLW